MILQDFLVFDEHGLYCRAGDFYVDPISPVAVAVISHAHGDHACPGNQMVICTTATKTIMQLRLKKNAGSSFRTFNFNESFELNGVKLQFIPAGHILGSAQILMEYRGVRYLYTGDFKLQKDPTCEPINFVTADVLITETTFANPEIKHPAAEEEICKLNGFEHNILLGAYALGKSQRLIGLINSYCPGRTILLHHTILPIARIYEQFGFLNGNYHPYNRKLMKEPGKGFVYIVPPLTFDCYFRAKGVVRIFASGWKKRQLQNDLELYISDHADWDDILTLIGKVKPSEIWTLHGDGKYLVKHFYNTLPVKVLN